MTVFEIFASPEGGRPRVVCFLRLVTVVALYLYLNASLLLLLSLVYNVQFLVPTTTSWTFSNLLVLAQYDSLVILTQAIPQFLWWSMVWAEITSVTDNCYAHPDDEIVRCWLFYSFLSTGWPSYFSFRFKSYLLFAASTILDVYALRILLFPNTFEFPPRYVALNVFCKNFHRFSLQTALKWFLFVSRTCFVY